MARFTEANFKAYTRPPSITEEEQLRNAERMVREAISAHPKLKLLETETFGQGSYANNTNVKLNSDIDINVRLSSSFFYNIPSNKLASDFNLNSPTEYTFKEYKDTVQEALENKFGKSEVVRNDKCLTVKGNTYRVETDVVPTWKYREYYENGKYVVGAKFISDKGRSILNYPLQHIDNGVSKNTNTHRRFKRNVRIIKRIRYQMIDSGVHVSNGITSFLLECLFWNVPNQIFNANDLWSEQLKGALSHIYINTETEEKCKEWGEVSELLYLFRGHKWTVKEVNEFIASLWKYSEF